MVCLVDDHVLHTGLEQHTHTHTHTHTRTLDTGSEDAEGGATASELQVLQVLQVLQQHGLSVAGSVREGEMRSWASSRGARSWAVVTVDHRLAYLTRALASMSRELGNAAAAVGGKSMVGCDVGGGVGSRVGGVVGGVVGGKRMLGNDVGGGVCGGVGGAGGDVGGGKVHVRGTTRRGVTLFVGEGEGCCQTREEVLPVCCCVLLCVDPSPHAFGALQHTETH